MTMNIDSSGMQWAGSIADFEEGTNASAQWGLNASAPVLSEVYQDNVDAGMAYGAESGGLEADGTEPCEDNMSSSEMSSALCAGIQTEIDRVFSNGIFIDNKVHFSDRVELLTELSYHTDHACDKLTPSIYAVNEKVSTKKCTARAVGCLQPLNIASARLP